MTAFCIVVRQTYPLPLGNQECGYKESIPVCDEITDRNTFCYTHIHGAGVWIDKCNHGHSSRCAEQPTTIISWVRCQGTSSIFSKSEKISTLEPLTREFVEKII